jgi:gliding motility-associated-like protein
MLKAVHLYVILTVGIVLLGSHIAYSAGPLVVNPGPPQTVCAGDSVTLGGTPTASGGTAPYTYSWTPVAGMNNPTDPNPRVKVTTTTMFYVRVQDNAGGTVDDSVKITVDNVTNVTAGPNQTMCFYLDSAVIGAPTNPTGGGYTYSWLPVTGLSCSNCANPIAKPTATTTYTLTAKHGGCTNTTMVTVTVLPPPVVTTISPVTIERGQSAILSVSGLSGNYQWMPSATLSSPTSASPQASPIKTTTYTVIGTDASGCYGVDSVVVDVLQDSLLIFYNTFTPNGDGINDTWFIGNIDLFPNNEVLIYNRYGKQVYRANGYLNQWDGTSQGTNLPDATYYYLVYTGTGQTYKGSVTIIREPH